MRSPPSLLETFTSGPAPRVSFEFFPPKTPEMEEKLWQCVQALAPLAPVFVSVTYGAGGSTRARTHATVKRIATETGLQAAAHLTCVGATREEVQAVARAYCEAGIRHIVALRGDPPAGSGGYVPHPGGYAYACDLVEGLREVADFDISVAAYPEKHPEALSMEADIEALKRKEAAGAHRAITQYFFDIEHFLRFRDQAAARGVGLPLIPGILPVSNVEQLHRFSAMCGASVPLWLAALFEGQDNDPGQRALLAVYIAALQCRLLQKEGVEQFHFYTLNRPELCKAICHVLGVRPRQEAETKAFANS